SSTPGLHQLSRGDPTDQLPAQANFGWVKICRLLRATSFTQLDAVFGARRQSNDSAAERRAQARPIHSLVRQPLPSAATLGPSASKEVGNVQGCCPPVEVLIIEQAPLHLEDLKTPRMSPHWRSEISFPSLYHTSLWRRVSSGLAKRIVRGP